LTFTAVLWWADYGPPLVWMFAAVSLAGALFAYLAPGPLRNRYRLARRIVSRSRRLYYAARRLARRIILGPAPAPEPEPLRQDAAA
jgi:hypothetical protein